MNQHRIPDVTVALPGLIHEATYQAAAEALQETIDSISADVATGSELSGDECDYRDRLNEALRLLGEAAAKPPTHCIVIDNYDEPGRHRYSVVGQYESHEAAYAALPGVVRGLIADPEGTKPEDASHTPEELEVEVDRIASTGDGDAFGFYVWITPWSAN
jgi:hypothetical protein